LSKYDKWRMVWSSGRQEGRVFGRPSIELTSEQQSLIAWSKLYDNINEHPESPPKEVIDDDDLLDGWLILEQKKNKHKPGNNKHGKPGASEVFIPVESKEDAVRVGQMNDAKSRFIKAQRMAVLQKQGAVLEQNMPDSQQRLSIQAAQQFRERVKNNRK